jgi:hypothetical protein
MDEQIKSPSCFMQEKEWNNKAEINQMTENTQSQVIRQTPRLQYGLEELIELLNELQHSFKIHNEVHDEQNHYINDHLKIINDTLNNQSEFRDKLTAIVHSIDNEMQNYEVFHKALNRIITFSEEQTKINYEILEKYSNLEKKLEASAAISDISAVTMGFFEKFKDQIPINNADTKEWFQSVLPNYLKSQSDLIKKIKEENNYLNLLVKKSENQPIDQIKDIKWLDAYFDQGQRSFFEQKPDDPASAAILSFLINHSLTELSSSIADENEIKKLGMLNNLYVISKVLSNLNIRGFDFALEGLKEKFNFNSQLNLPITNEAHKNDRLFQVMIFILNKQREVHISPFYIDIDKDGKLHQVG